MKEHMISMGKVQTQSEGYEMDRGGDYEGKRYLVTFLAKPVLPACASCMCFLHVLPACASTSFSLTHSPHFHALFFLPMLTSYHLPLLFQIFSTWAAFPPLGSPILIGLSKSSIDLCPFFSHLQ
ncbi:hypothetical protein VNO77_16665 [Canavalia gladiata]|uniref:Uncharacterized protein n=1 Tax=Canavalia gladiata TaxID=3824 RepID=A0AAN9LHJ7_CANGL